MIFHTEFNQNDEVVVHVVAETRPLIWSRCEVANGERLVASEEDFSKVEPQGRRCEDGCFA